MSEYKKYRVIIDGKESIVYGTNINYRDFGKDILKDDVVVASLNNEANIIIDNSHDMYDMVELLKLNHEKANELHKKFIKNE